MQDMAYGMQGYDLTFDMKIEDSVPKMLFGDSMRISYIASRLLDYRFMSTSEGWILLKVSARKFSYATVLIIEVSDTGAAIDAKKQSLIQSYADSGNVFNADLTDETNSGVEVVGLLIHQVSGSISFDDSQPGTNVIKIEIPQLELNGEDK